MAARKRLIFWLILGFAFLYSLLSWRRHMRFDSFAFDLGISDQVVWLYSRGQVPFSTIKGKITFGDHFGPSLILLAPLFWIWDDVRILLIFQAIFISFSAYPIFLLARRRQLPEWLSLVISAVYLSFFGWQHAINFDFHTSVIAASLVSWLIYFLETKQWRRLAILAVIFAGFKENLPLTLAALGLVACLRKEIKQGLLMIILSLGYFFLVIFLVIPHFSPTGYEYQPSLPVHQLADWQKAVLALFWPQEKLETWFYSLSWFSFLPLLAPLTLIPVVMDLAPYFLAGERYAATWGLFMHYRASLAPLLVWGMIEGLAKLRPLFKRRWWLAVIILLLPLYFQYTQHLPLNRLSKAYFWQEESWMKDNRQLISQIPAAASIAAQNNLVPHLSHRQEIYPVWPRQKDGQWWLFWAGSPAANLCEICSGQPEYLLVDLHQGQWLTHLLVNSEKELAEAVANLEQAGQIKLQTQINAARLYRIVDVDNNNQAK